MVAHNTATGGREGGRGGGGGGGRGGGREEEEMTFIGTTDLSYWVLQVSREGRGKVCIVRDLSTKMAVSC